MFLKNIAWSRMWPRRYQKAIFACCFVVTVFFIGKRIFVFHCTINESDTRTHENRFIDLQRVSKPSMITIFWINKPHWVSMEEGNYGLRTMCQYTNCRMSNVTKNISAESAIVFSTQEPLDLQLNPRDKRMDQVWIFFRMEPPTHALKITWYKNPLWSNTMNWSWSYRLDSDVFQPYHTLVTRSLIPKRNYSEIFKRKTKVAAWVVSNCKTQSKRRDYVKQLIRHGIPVDIYGRCSQRRIRENFTDIVKKINNNYKFYLSFENSFCQDYVTEKFFKYYDLDVVLVVRGGLNYSEHFDKSTFINANDYTTAKDLARFLLKVMSSERLYTEYLRSKDKYESLSWEASRHETYCRLCERLNHKEHHHRVYDNISEYLLKDKCFTPNGF